MIHYHGGPITPVTCALKAWTGRHACISFAAPEQMPIAAEVCQSFIIDNGAFTFWRQGTPVHWQDFYAWVQQWESHPGCDFIIAPDVIDGTEAENDALLAKCPLPHHRIAAVWHINESIERLQRQLAEAVAKEREACAKVADQHREKWGNAGGFGGHSAGARIIAAAIRERT